jgi:diaminopimelate decarboxylase
MLIDDHTSTLLAQCVDKYATPLYVTDMAVLRSQIFRLKSSISFPNHILLYACKANNNPHILKEIIQAGIGIECVSIGEVFLALSMEAKYILYTNNNVSNDEFDEVIELSIKEKYRCTIWINCDSIDKLERVPASSGVFLRINGSVGSGHHHHVITCGSESKFGIDIADFPKAIKVASEKNVKIIGLHQHIGSGITSMEIYEVAMNVLYSAVADYIGLLPDLMWLDFGGGIGVNYRLDETSSSNMQNIEQLGSFISSSFSKFLERVNRPALGFILEPGRYFVAESTVLLAKVNTIKHQFNKTWVGIDTGMNHLIRPMMYNSYHHISNLSNLSGPKKEVFVVGNICESGDVFTRSSDGEIGSRSIEEISMNDVLILHTAGAYGYAMSSTYNMRPQPLELAIDSSHPESAPSVIRRTKSPKEFVADMLTQCSFVNSISS